MMSELIPTIKYKQSPLRLVFYAVFFSLMLFLLLPLSRMFQDYIEPKDLVRTIEIATPPPPPPQQQQRETEVTVDDVINIQKVETEIEVEPLNIQLDASLVGDLKVQIDIGSFNVRQGNSDLASEIRMFQLNELDSTPMSINDPLFRAPEELIENKVDEINAEALVILNEKGEVQFIQFISLSHQLANTEVREYINKLKYTPPTKDGEVGMVRFRLPLRIPVSNLGEKNE